MNVKTPHRLNGMIRSEYEGANLSLSEFNALEGNWRVIYQRVMERAGSVGLYELWSARTASIRFRVASAELIATLLPAHINVEIQWLSQENMATFEHSYFSAQEVSFNGNVINYILK